MIKNNNTNSKASPSGKFGGAVFGGAFLALSCVCIVAFSQEPSNKALVIPMNETGINILYDPSGGVYFSDDELRGTADGLAIDLGEVDFGNNGYNCMWVEMANPTKVSDDANFAFYLDDELVLPKTTLNIPFADEPHISYGSEKTPQSGLFFKNKSSAEVTVINIVSDDNIAKLTSIVAQGVLNQDSAEVYLLVESHHKGQLDYTGRAYTQLPKYSHELYGGLASLVNKYKDRFTKMILWEEEKEWTWCMAQMMCAQQQAIPVTETIRDFLVNELAWNIPVEDIRNNWSNKITAYNWAIENLADACHPTLSFSAGLRSDYKTAPWKIYDYAAVSKGFVFYLDESNSQEADMIRKICQKMNYQPGATTLGYGYNSDGDALNKVINKYNVGFTVSDYYANGSFWCSYPHKSFQQREGKAVEAEAGKIYVSLIWSDGDNIQFDANVLYTMFEKAEGRGEVPVGITMASSLQELNPVLLEYFYKNLTSNDELMAGPTGFQFIYGDSYNDDTYNDWLEMNQKWMETAGFHTACLWNTSNDEKFNRYMSTCCLQGVFDGNSRANNRYIDGVVAVNQGTHCWAEGNIYEDLMRVSPDSNKPLFRNLFLIAAEYGGNDGYQRILRELKKLEAERPDTYIYMLPKDLCATLKQYIIENGGSYE